MSFFLFAALDILKRPSMTIHFLGSQSQLKSLQKTVPFQTSLKFPLLLDTHFNSIINSFHLQTILCKLLLKMKIKAVLY